MNDINKTLICGAFMIGSFLRSSLEINPSTCLTNILYVAHTNHKNSGRHILSLIFVILRGFFREFRGGEGFGLGLGVRTHIIITKQVT